MSAETALRANPDGYNGLVSTSQLFIATSSVYPKLKFDLDRDFASLARAGRNELNTFPSAERKRFTALVKATGANLQ